MVTSLAGIGGVAEVNLNAVASVGGDCVAADSEVRELKAGLDVSGMEGASN